jgi:hypothetical protein
MKEFDEEELVRLHECLKYVNIPEKLPSSKITDYFVDIFNSVLDEVSMNQRLAVLTYMAYVTLFDLIEEKEDIREMMVEG